MSSSLNRCWTIVLLISSVWIVTCNEYFLIIKSYSTKYFFCHNLQMQCNYWMQSKLYWFVTTYRLADIYKWYHRISPDKLFKLVTNELSVRQIKVQTSSVRQIKVQTLNLHVVQISHERIVSEADQGSNIVSEADQVLNPKPSRFIIQSTFHCIREPNTNW